MNWRDFKCWCVFKFAYRWWQECSGRGARLTDQEDLPALSVWREKTSQNPLIGTSEERCAHIDFIHSPWSTVTTEKRSTTKLLSAVSVRKSLMQLGLWLQLFKAWHCEAPLMLGGIIAAWWQSCSWLWRPSETSDIKLSLTVQSYFSTGLSWKAVLQSKHKPSNSKLRCQNEPEPDHH